MAEGFVHLHNHTEYSMLDGAARVEELVVAARADGQRALAITDHGNLYGVIDFYETCRRHGVQPIIGLEAYMAAGLTFRPPDAPGQDRRHRRRHRGRPEALPPPDAPRRLEPGLPELARALLARLSRGLLLQAPARLGAARAPRRRTHRDVGLPGRGGAAGPRPGRPREGARARGPAPDHLRPRELLRRTSGPRPGVAGAHESRS